VKRPLQSPFSETPSKRRRLQEDLKADTYLAPSVPTLPKFLTQTHMSYTPPSRWLLILLTSPGNTPQCRRLAHFNFPKANGTGFHLQQSTNYLAPKSNDSLSPPLSRLTGHPSPRSTTSAYSPRIEPSSQNHSIHKPHFKSAVPFQFLPRSGGRTYSSFSKQHATSRM
jgi:hypothetical protein